VPFAPDKCVVDNYIADKHINIHAQLTALLICGRLLPTWAYIAVPIAAHVTLRTSHTPTVLSIGLFTSDTLFTRISLRAVQIRGNVLATIAAPLSRIGLMTRWTSVTLYSL
jgi:hypothetical protein